MVSFFEVRMICIAYRVPCIQASSIFYSHTGCGNFFCMPFLSYRVQPAQPVPRESVLGYPPQPIQVRVYSMLIFLTCGILRHMGRHAGIMLGRDCLGVNGSRDETHRIPPPNPRLTPSGLHWCLRVWNSLDLRAARRNVSRVAASSLRNT